MTIDVDVLMPVAGSAYAEAAAAHLDTYRAGFAAAGMTLTAIPWDTAPGNGRVTLASFAWGYHFDVVRWEAMLAAWPPDRLLLNAPTLLAWNTRKTYLEALQRQNIRIVPSIFCDADAASVAAAFDDFGCDEIVVKPQVSGGSHCTVRVKPGDMVAPLPAAILQPFVPAIGTEGELSFLFVGGTISHAVRKVAAVGDFRIQPQFGGVFTRFELEPAQIAQAQAVIAALPVPPLYARVDLLRLADGGLALMEVEVIEPDLYPHLAPEVPGNLAMAMRDRL